MAAGAPLVLGCTALKGRFEGTRELGHSTSECAPLEHQPLLSGSGCTGLSLVSCSQDFHISLYFNLKTCGLIFQSTKKSLFSPISGFGQELSPLPSNYTGSFWFSTALKDRSAAITWRAALFLLHQCNAVAWRLCLCSSGLGALSHKATVIMGQICQKKHSTVSAFDGSVTSCGI